MATLYEQYTAGIDGITHTRGVYWHAQVLTVGTVGANVEHDLTSVKIKAYRLGNPGTVTVSLRAVVAGLPSGPDLVSDTFNGNALTVDTGGEEVEILLPYSSLLPDTPYAIVVRAPTGDNSNKLHWLQDRGATGYAGGVACESSNSGGAWIKSGPADDWGDWFQEYGDPVSSFIPRPSGGTGGVLIV